MRNSTAQFTIGVVGVVGAIGAAVVVAIVVDGREEGK
jgi:hypothetical protein